MASMSPFDSVPTGARRFGGDPRGRTLGGPSEPVVLPSKRGRQKAEPAPLPVSDDGWSTCPTCLRTWLVLAHDDVLLPDCGHLGTDWSRANRWRPCTVCALKHEQDCDECVDTEDDAALPDQWAHGPEHIHGKGLS